MKRAWVITQEGPNYPTEVIGVLTARKSAATVKDYVEWLYALLHYGPDGHLAFATYTKRAIPCQAEYWTTNTGAPMNAYCVVPGSAICSCAPAFEA